MKASNCKSYLTGCLCLCLVFLTGCLPSIHKVSKTLSGMPVGISRDEVRANLVKTFKRDLLWQPPKQLAAVNINDDKTMITIRNKNGEFVYVYPPDLYDKMPSKVFFNMIGVSESNNGGGSLTLFYDSNRDYALDKYYSKFPLFSQSAGF